MKRLLCFVFSALFLCLSALPVGAIEPVKVENTDYAFIYNPVFDEVLYESKADKVIYPASTVKIMTGIIAIEYYGERTDTVITITEEVLELTSGTKLSYKLGERLTVEQLLYGLIVGNANDAAYALALSICPTVEEFVDLMNKKAKSLGAEDTVYANPTGYDDNKAQTTVRDLSKIAAYAAGMKDFIKYSRCERYDMEPTNMVGIRTIANKNWLVSTSYVDKYFLPYATGLNAGYTKNGGECCVVSATKDGVSIIAVVMKAPHTETPTVNYAFEDAKNMLKWAFSAYGYQKVLGTSEIVCEIPVSLSAEHDYVALLPGEDVYAFLPSDIDVEEDIERRYTLYEESLTAPFPEGREVGVMTLHYNGEEIGRAPLVTKMAMARSSALAAWTYIKGVLTNIWTVVVVIALIVFLGCVILANAYMRGRKKK